MIERIRSFKVEPEEKQVLLELLGIALKRRQEGGKVFLDDNECDDRILKELFDRLCIQIQKEQKN